MAPRYPDMTLGLSDLHKLSHAEKGLLSGGANGDSESVGLLPSVPASPVASSVAAAPLLIPSASRETSTSLVWGLVLYAACTVCSSGMSVLAKLAHGHGIPILEIVLVRSAMVSDSYVCNQDQRLCYYS